MSGPDTNPPYFFLNDRDADTLIHNSASVAPFNVFKDTVDGRTVCDEFALPATQLSTVYYNGDTSKDANAGLALEMDAWVFSTNINGNGSSAPASVKVQSQHTDPFQHGQQGIYTVTVSNDAGFGPSSGVVSVREVLGAGLSLVSMGGTGWTCSVQTTYCQRSDTLLGGQPYPPITVTVNITGVLPTSNTVSVSVGNSVAGGSLGGLFISSDATAITQ